MTDGRFERNEKALLQPPADRWTEHGQTPVHIHQPKSHHIIVKIPSTIISSVEKKFLVVFLSLVLTASCSLPSATKQEASYKTNCKRERLVRYHCILFPRFFLVSIMKIFWIMSSNLVMNYCMGLWLMGSRRLAAKAFSTNSLSTTTTTTRRMITPILTTTTTKVLRMSSTTDDSIDSYGRRIRRRPRPQEDVDDGWGDTSGGAGGWNDDNDGDDYRRQQRRRQRSSGGWDDDDNDDDGWGAPSSHSRQARDSGGWDDFDPFDDKPQRRGGRGQRSSPSRQREWRKDYSRNNHNKRHSRPSQRKFDGNQKKTDKSNRSINMNALEGAGFVHLYGLSSIVNALKADRRDLTTVHDRSENLFGDDNDNNEEPREAPKPQAQFRPYLFVQERKAAATNQRTGQKASTAEQVLELAKERDVPVAYVDKGVLNTLSGNRPHQVRIVCLPSFFSPRLHRPINLIPFLFFFPFLF